MRERESLLCQVKREEKMENTDELVSIELPAPTSWKKLVSSFFSSFFFPNFSGIFFCCDCFYFPLKEIDVCKRVLSCLFSILSKFLFLSYGLGFIFDLGNLMKVTVFKVGFGICMFSSLIR